MLTAMANSEQRQAIINFYMEVDRANLDKLLTVARDRPSEYRITGSQLQTIERRFGLDEAMRLCQETINANTNTFRPGRLFGMELVYDFSSINELLNLIWDAKKIPSKMEEAGPASRLIRSALGYC